MKNLIILILSIFLVSCSGINSSPGTEKAETNEADEQISQELGQNDIKKDLSDSPRHQEWVEIDNDGKTIHAFVVYPENKNTSSAVIMIHENKGLNDWARNIADQIAAEGYIVVAPDLLSSFDETRNKTSDFATADDATKALYSINQEVISSDLVAVSEYVKSIDTFNGNLVSAGFCWGGSQSFRLATKKDDFKASLVFYGTAPEDEDFYENIDIPVYGFYAENDDRVNSTIAQTEAEMLKNENTFDYEIYDGVGHAFMRKADTDESDELSQQAKESAFERMKTILSEYK